MDGATSPNWMSSMNNPWLQLSLADYEGHMSSPEVQQLAALSDLFAEALAICRPASLAVVGVAGGNGLDRIDGYITKHILESSCVRSFSNSSSVANPSTAAAKSFLGFMGFPSGAE